MPNCDPSIYVHHVALLSSGSDHINRVRFHPLSACLFRSRFDCGAEGSSCLQAVPVEVFSSSDRSPASLCGSSNRPARQTGYVRHAFRLLSSSSVDQRECSPAGVSLPPFSLSPQLQAAVVLGDTLPDCLRHVDVNMDVRAGGKRQGVQYIVTSEECIASLCRARLRAHVSIVSSSEQCRQCEPAL